MKKLLSLTALLLPFLAQALPFVTTSSPDTYPIHWYQLTINDRYVYYDPNASIFDQIKLTTTESSENNFLWCFVQMSSDKILIYNKAALGYMEEDQFITYDINSSYICHVVERTAGGGFFIRYYHNGDGRYYYLYEYIGEGYDFLSSASAALSSSIFNAVEVYVEGDFITGDVTGDGAVDIDDVNAAINLILKYDQNKDKYPGSADLDGNGIVDVDDVNAIINIILNLD